MSKSEKNHVKFAPKEEITFHAPSKVNILFHNKRHRILSSLVEKEMTVYDLKTSLNLNPGVVKRHIDKLLEADLIVQTRITTNDFGMNLKYYRARATRFLINLEWPRDMSNS